MTARPGHVGPERGAAQPVPPGGAPRGSAQGERPGGSGAEAASRIAVARSGRAVAAPVVRRQTPAPEPQMPQRALRPRRAEEGPRCAYQARPMGARPGPPCGPGRLHRTRCRPARAPRLPGAAGEDPAEGAWGQPSRSNDAFVLDRVVAGADTPTVIKFHYGG